MIDLHCHILPGVDDGAKDLEDSVELIRSEVRQGVTDICLTPHTRIDMFCTPDEKISIEFTRLKAQLAEEKLDVTLHLSREYFYDSEFRKRLKEGDVIPFGDYDTLLVEFSLDAPTEILLEASKRIQDAGYNAMFAHIERYHAIQRDQNIAKRLMDQGTILQINAGALLGYDGKQLNTVAWGLLEKGYVHVIASDAHDLKHRTPCLRACYNMLKKEIGKQNTEILMHENPLAILCNPGI